MNKEGSEIMNKQMKSALEYMKWLAYWSETTWKCDITKETFKVPEKIRECDFYSFGDSYIDLGRAGSYSRFGGDPILVDQPYGELYAKF